MTLRNLTLRASVVFLAGLTALTPILSESEAESSAAADLGEPRAIPEDAPRTRSVEQSTIEFQRLRFSLPGNWAGNPAESTLTITSPEYAGSAITIVEPSDERTWTAVQFLLNGITGMERGRQTLRVYPERPQQGVTASGAGYVFQSRVSRDQQGRLRYTAYYAFSTGSRFQAVIAMAETAPAFQQVIPALGQSLNNVRVSVPQAGTQASTGPELGFFAYRLRHLPDRWTVEESPFANMMVLQCIRLPGRADAVGSVSEFRVIYELQPNVPVSPLAALQNFLIGRAPLAMANLELNPARITKIAEGTLNNGLQYTGLALEQDNDDRFYLAAWMIQGPGYSLIIGTGLKYFRYDMIRRNSTFAQDQQLWYRHFNNLLSVAESVQWEPGGVERDQNLERWLLSQRQFRYHRESSIVGSDISFFSSNKRFWDFLPGNEVRYEIDHFRSFNSFDVTPTGLPDYSSGYLTNAGSTDNARFVVVRQAGQNYILVNHPNGLYTFHPFVQQPFTIDGFRHGCCS